MGKNKRLKGAFSSAKNKPQRLQTKAPIPASSKTSASSKKPAAAQHTEPTIPFKKNDRILLVGEGDLSFAASLVRAHKCTNITATVFEKNLEELVGKYPHVGENVEIVQTGASASSGLIGEREEGSWEGCEDDNKDRIQKSLQIEEEVEQVGDEGDFDVTMPRIGKVIYSIDATKMGPYYDPVAKAQGKGKLGAFDNIQFMFPHCGGKSTDVNRQVRYNQELIVGFFKRALPSLAPKGSICVTLFEGQPYELWCIRNLARHTGLAVEKSFKFQASAYPGYHHARTLGVIRNKNGEVGGGWKGEERAARTYVFRKPTDLPAPPKTSKKRKVDPDLDDLDDD